MTRAIAASLTDNQETKRLLKSEKQIVKSKLPGTLVIGKDVPALGNCVFDAFLEAAKAAKAAATETSVTKFDLYDVLGGPPGFYTPSLGFTPVVALRNQVMDVVEQHLEHFRQYFDLTQHQGQVTSYEDYSFQARFDAFVWGCEVTLHALAQAFEVTIHVYNSHPDAPMK